MDLVIKKIKQRRIEDAESPKKLIIEDKKPLVLFGEGNFTHAVAIAALRESSWDGITATSLYGDLLEMLQGLQIGNDEAQIEENSEIDNLFGKALLTAIQFSVHNTSALAEQNYQVALRRIEILCQLEPPCATAWKTDVDATNIKESDQVDVKGKVAWFQCPWILGGQTSRLVENFLKHMDNKEAEYILIGISTHWKYVNKYKLNNILSCEAQAGVVSKVDHYVFLGSDNELIRDVLKYGYKHHSEGQHDIHDYIINEHLTLVFKRIRDNPRS
jgi:hypothetical protein